MHVRFAPKADKQQIISSGPLCANSDLTRRSKRHGYSITSSALVSSEGGGVPHFSKVGAREGKTPKIAFGAKRCP
jgi:hypothetical protein